jgi:hypothetical protein
MTILKIGSIFEVRSTSGAVVRRCGSRAAADAYIAAQAPADVE